MNITKKIIAGMVAATVSITSYGALTQNLSTAITGQATFSELTAKAEILDKGCLVVEAYQKALQDLIVTDTSSATYRVNQGTFAKKVGEVVTFDQNAQPGSISKAIADFVLLKTIQSDTAFHIGVAPQPGSVSTANPNAGADQHKYSVMDRGGNAFAVLTQCTNDTQMCSGLVCYNHDYSEPYYCNSVATPMGNGDPRAAATLQGDALLELCNGSKSGDTKCDTPANAQHSHHSLSFEMKVNKSGNPVAGFGAKDDGIMWIASTKYDPPIADGNGDSVMLLTGDFTVFDSDGLNLTNDTGSMANIPLSLVTATTNCAQFVAAQRQ
jgi:hypothetical protein